MLKGLHSWSKLFYKQILESTCTCKTQTELKGKGRVGISGTGSQERGRYWPSSAAWRRRGCVRAPAVRWSCSKVARWATKVTAAATPSPPPESQPRDSKPINPTQHNAMEKLKSETKRTDLLRVLRLVHVVISQWSRLHLNFTWR